MLNRERLLVLAEVLESKRAEGHFDMHDVFESASGAFQAIDVGEDAATFVETCGSTACICGWAIAIFDPKSPLYSEETFLHGGSLLGLNATQITNLFAPSLASSGGKAFDRQGRELYDATPKEAAKVVRYLAETGEVDWAKALEE